MNKTNKSIAKYKVKLVREKNFQYEICINSSKSCQDQLMEILNIKEWHNEKFGIVALDNANNIIGIHIISEGTINESRIYIREIILRALLNNASNIVLFHNHPANTLKPSQADINTTNDIKNALNLVNIKVIDHIILTVDGTYSFAEHGYI